MHTLYFALAAVWSEQFTRGVSGWSKALKIVIQNKVRAILVRILKLSERQIERQEKQKN